MVETIEWVEDNAGGHVLMIDQRLLPRQQVFVKCRTYEEVADAIQTMVIRGAPAIGVAAAMGVGLFCVLKQMARRPRPCALAPHAWATLLPPDQVSFPSGHTMTAFAVITPLLLWSPEMALGLLFCALSVAASRIVLGMHFLSDVVAGAALGVLVGYFSSTMIHSVV